MKAIDLSFWRFVIIIYLSRSFLWKKDDDTFLFHIGTFSKGPYTALRLILLPLSLCVGYITPKRY